MAQADSKPRQSNMELLRVIAMLMIITLHYLDKGNVLVEFGQMQSLNHYMAWIVEALCYVSVNIYVLISGYFLVTSKFTFKKLFLLWAQILFYSWVIGGILLLTGMVGEEATTFYELIYIALPVTTGHYWFATVYVLLFAIFPFLNAGIEKMSRKQHKACFMLLVILFSVWKTILPMALPMADGKGMDIVWFVCLYMIAAYIRKYPDCIRRKKYVYILGYFLWCVITFGVGLLLLVAERFIGKLGGYATCWYDYNSLPILLASVCLFVAFLKIDIRKPLLCKGINALATATFGIYLIHEHRYLRYLWPQWLMTEQSTGTPWMILHLLISIIVVFVICALIEWIRKWLFSLITERKWFKDMFKHISPIENDINGEA